MNDDKDGVKTFNDYGQYLEWERTFVSSPPSLSGACKFLLKRKIFYFVDKRLSIDDEFLHILTHLPSTQWFVRVWFALTRRAPRNRKASPVRGIVRLADIFGLGLRREIKAMAAEFEVEIKRLHRERRPAMARWNIILAWTTAVHLCFLAVPEKLRGWVRTVLGFVAGYFLK